jgi:hypothetical protein
MKALSPDEIISELKLLGVNMTRRTLLNYEKQHLIEEPERGGGGTGGRWTNYPDGTVDMAFQAYKIMKLCKNKDQVRYYLNQSDEIKQIILKFLMVLN